MPLHDYGSVLSSLDLHNPNNESAQRGYDSSLVEMAIVADAGYFTAAVPNSPIDRELSIEAQNERRGAIGPTGRFVDASTPDGRVRPWDFLWSITTWGNSRLREDVVARVKRLAVTEQMLTGIDPYGRPHVRIERRRLRTGALFLQSRFLFRSELRSSRTAIGRTLAAQAGLRSTERPQRR